MDTGSFCNYNLFPFYIGWSRSLRGPFSHFGLPISHSGFMGPEILLANWTPMIPPNCATKHTIYRSFHFLITFWWNQYFSMDQHHFPPLRISRALRRRVITLGSFVSPLLNHLERWLNLQSWTHHPTICLSVSPFIVHEAISRTRLLSLTWIKYHENQTVQ